MEILFCGSPILEIDVLVNTLGWEDGTRLTIKLQPFHNCSVVFNSRLL